MHRRIVSFFIYFFLVTFAFYVFLPLPWLIYEQVNGYNQFMASPFYYFGSAGIVLIGPSSVYWSFQRFFSGFLGFMAIVYTGSGLRHRRSAYRNSSEDESRKMSTRFLIAAFLLIISFLLFYYGFHYNFGIGSIFNVSIIYFGGTGFFFMVFYPVLFLSISLAAGASQKFGTASRSRSGDQPAPQFQSYQRDIPARQDPPVLKATPGSTGVDDRDSIGIIGPVASGKTTMFAYFLHFLRNTTSSLNVDYEVMEGQDYYRDFLDKILREKQFPGGTAADTPNRMLIRLYSTGKLRTKEIFLELNDIAGELFASNSTNPQRRREAFIYLAACMGYIFVVDCSTYKDWTSEDLRFSSILSDLYRATGERRKLKSPISFIFTKPDMLPEAVFNKSPSDLLESLPSTMSFVKAHFDDYSAFKTYIKTERNEEGKIIPKIDTLAGARADLVYDPSLNYGFQQLTEWICDKGKLL